MKCFVGIDLGSTTTKAVVLDENGAILGRGITNSRSNYDLAAKVAREEAFITARFGLLRQKGRGGGRAGAPRPPAQGVPPQPDPRPARSPARRGRR